MDFIFGIVFVLLIIFIMINYISISITNNDKTNYLYSPRTQLTHNRYLSSNHNLNHINNNNHNNNNNNNNNNNLNSILNLKEDSYNYNKYFHL